MAIGTVSSFNNNTLLIPSQPIVELCGLEKEYEDFCFPDQVDTITDPGFPDFLLPNESYPERLKEHLKYWQKGYLVSTGTERSIFALIFSDWAMCRGLIDCDFNPRVKAYFDFNVLLLRISKTKEEYAALSSTTESEQTFAERIHLIRGKLQSSHLAEKVRNYYQNHLHDFGSIYLKLSKSWRESRRFHECKYWSEDTFFNTLKAYIESGNVISVIRNINDLTFIGDKRVSIVDVSNIPHYCFLDLKGGSHFRPQVIWTDFVKGNGFWYQSYNHQTISQEDSSEFDRVLSIFKQSTQLKKNYPHGDEYALWMVVKQRQLRLNDKFSANIGAIRSVATLRFLKEYCEQNVFKLPQSVFVNMEARNIKKLNEYSPLGITALFQNEKVPDFTHQIVNAWQHLNPDVYLTLGQLPRWKDKFNDTFEKYICKNPAGLPPFLEKMEKAGLLERFIYQFGKDRLLRLINAVKMSHAIPKRYFEEVEPMDYSSYMASIQFDFKLKK